MARTKKQDHLDGYRDADADDGREDETVDAYDLGLPASLNEIDVLDVAFEIRAELKDVKSVLSYLLHAAKEEARQANRELLNCDPFEGNRIRELQWKWQRYNALMQWVMDMLVKARFIEHSKTDEEMAVIRQKLAEAGAGEA